VVLDILDREGGAVRITIGSVVRKEFNGPDAVQRVSDLVAIYESLKKKECHMSIPFSATTSTRPSTCFSVAGGGRQTSGLWVRGFRAVVCVLKP
jgi:hypothetical protein